MTDRQQGKKRLCGFYFALNHARQARTCLKKAGKDKLIITYDTTFFLHQFATPIVIFYNL
jgi:hypothetical protein